MHHIYICIRITMAFQRLREVHFLSPYPALFHPFRFNLSFTLSLSFIRSLSLSFKYAFSPSHIHSFSFSSFFFFCLYIYCYWIHCIVVVSPIRTDITHLLLHFFFFSPYLLLLFSPSFLASSFLLAPFIVPLWFERNCWREDVERFSIFRFRGSFLLFFFFVSTLLTVITEKEQYFWKGTAPKKKKKKKTEEKKHRRNEICKILLSCSTFFFFFILIFILIRYLETGQFLFVLRGTCSWSILFHFIIQGMTNVCGNNLLREESSVERNVMQRNERVARSCFRIEQGIIDRSMYITLIKFRWALSTKRRLKLS